MTTGFAYYAFEIYESLWSRVFAGGGFTATGGGVAIDLLMLVLGVSPMIGWHAVYGGLAAVLVAYIRSATTTRGITDPAGLPSGYQSDTSHFNRRGCDSGPTVDRSQLFKWIGVMAILTGGVILAANFIWSNGLMTGDNVPRLLALASRIVALVIFGIGLVAWARLDS